MNTDSITHAEVNNNFLVALSHSAQNGFHFHRGHRERLGSAAGRSDKSGNTRSVSNNIPGIICHDHLNKHIAGKHILHLLDLFAVFDLNLCFFCHKNTEQIVLNSHGLNSLLKIFLDTVLVSGIGIYDIPALFMFLIGNEADCFFLITHSFLHSNSDHSHEECDSEVTQHKEYREKSGKTENFSRIFRNIFSLRPANTFRFLFDSAPAECLIHTTLSPILFPYEAFFCRI